jgi:hypothetical protein
MVVSTGRSRIVTSYTTTAPKTTKRLLQGTLARHIGLVLLLVMSAKIFRGGMWWLC